LSFSPQLDEAFRVNVAKMRVQLPPGMREPIMEAISPVTKLANDRYRRTEGPIERERFHLNGNRGVAASRGASPVPKSAIDLLLAVADAQERRVIRRVAARLGKRRS
jgi:hypothetical protein